jgi:hypothetical protein
MEVIDIGLDNLEPISLNFNDNSSGLGESTPSVNFGTGIELLMNDKKKASSGNISIDLGELDKLENDLNDLSGVSSGGANYTTPSTPTGESKLLNGLGNMFGFKSGPNQSESSTNDSKLGSATVESIGKTSTWDGFSKMNDIPIESSSSKLSDREKRRKKRLMIKKLEEWYEKGLVKNITHFNMDSQYEEVEDEYETALEDKRKKDSIKLQGWWFMTFVNSVEYANAAFNPFDINLDGWGEQINEDIDSYDESQTLTTDNSILGILLNEILVVFGEQFQSGKHGFSLRNSGFRFDINQGMGDLTEHPWSNEPLVLEDPLNYLNNVGRNCYKAVQFQRVMADAEEKFKEIIVRHDTLTQNDMNKTLLLSEIFGPLSFDNKM